jgi:hypothetical protein
MCRIPVLRRTTSKRRSAGCARSRIGSTALGGGAPTSLAGPGACSAGRLAGGPTVNSSMGKMTRLSGCPGRPAPLYRSTLDVNGHGWHRRKGRSDADPRSGGASVGSPWSPMRLTSWSVSTPAVLSEPGGAFCFSTRACAGSGNAGRSPSRESERRGGVATAALIRAREFGASRTIASRAKAIASRLAAAGYRPSCKAVLRRRSRVARTPASR